MGYFKPKNMHLLEHGSNKKLFKPRTQEHNIRKYSSKFSITHIQNPLNPLNPCIPLIFKIQTVMKKVLEPNRRLNRK